MKRSFLSRIRENKLNVFFLFFVFIMPWSIGRQSYIPSGSMRSTLLEGDVVWVNTFYYGGRTPITPLSIPFLEGYYLDWIQLPSIKIPGLGTPKIGDVFVFHSPDEYEKPLDERTFIVKRCMAKPGNNMDVIEGVTYIEGEENPYNDIEGRQSKYQIDLEGFYYSSSEKAFLESFGILDISPTKKESTYIISINSQMTKKLLSSDEVVGLKPILKESKQEPYYFDYKKNKGSRFAESQGGNLSSLTGILLPVKGMEMEVTIEMLQTYGYLLEHHEGLKNVEIDKVEGTLKIDGKEVEKYIFRQGYFWGEGDNRGNSYDSRFIGFIPENHIVGYVSYIIYSTNRNPKDSFILSRLRPFLLDFRWSRFFRRIN